VVAAREMVNGEAKRAVERVTEEEVRGAARETPRTCRRRPC